MKTHTYSYNRALLMPNSVPVASVTVHGSTTSLSFADVLVDTGADYVQFPVAVAATAGISLTGATITRVSGIGGSVLMHLVSGVAIEIEGIAVTVEVLFHPSPTSRPLLGRSGLLKLSDFGFDVTDWLW